MVWGAPLTQTSPLSPCLTDWCVSGSMIWKIYHFNHGCTDRPSAQSKNREFLQMHSLPLPLKEARERRRKPQSFRTLNVCLSTMFLKEYLPWTMYFTFGWQERNSSLSSLLSGAEAQQINWINHISSISNKNLTCTESKAPFLCFISFTR